MNTYLLLVLLIKIWNKHQNKKYTHALISCPQACFTINIAIATSLLQAIKNCTKHEYLNSKLRRLSQELIPESLVEKKSQFKKLFNVCWNRVLFYTKLSGIDPCEKCINILSGQGWCNFFMDCSKGRLCSETSLWAWYDIMSVPSPLCTLNIVIRLS